MGWPSSVERERLERFPDEIALQDLRGSFTLKAADRDLVFAQHGPARVGVAVALCALRFMGFVPDDLASLPEHALVWVCEQVEADPADVLAYRRRAQTRSEDLAAVRSHLGFRAASAQDLDALARWLVGRAVEHDQPSALFSLAAEHLLARQIARPSVEQLARLIATAREATPTTPPGSMGSPRCRDLRPMSAWSATRPAPAAAGSRAATDWPATASGR
jgi:hypothetical protein